MSENKSFFGDYRISGQRYKHLTKFSRFLLFKPAAGTMQKMFPVGSKSDFQSWRKNLSNNFAFFRKMIAYVLKFSCDKLFKD